LKNCIERFIIKDKGNFLMKNWRIIMYKKNLKRGVVILCLSMAMAGCGNKNEAPIEEENTTIAVEVETETQYDGNIDMEETSVEESSTLEASNDIIDETTEVVSETVTSEIENDVVETTQNESESNVEETKPNNVVEESKANEEAIQETSTQNNEVAVQSIDESIAIQQEIAENEPIVESIIEEATPATSLQTTKVRDNTPVCYTPVASGETVYANSLASIDASNTAQGYIMVKYTGTNTKVKLQITGSNGVTYTYNLSGGAYETFPLSAGNGSYKIAIYENVTGNQYATALSQTISVNITNTFGPYLYPNQYVNFNASSQVVAKAKQLAEGCADDLEVITKIYNFATTITYDYNKANTVQSGYTSNVDAIMNSGTGICLDYAAVMASMLRSQNIPTRLEVGYAGTAYHAWISTYTAETGWINGIISFDGVNWSLMDPTFAANSSQETLKNFIGNGSNYSTKYIY
jgi:predicted small lipoprotein YifL